VTAHRRAILFEVGHGNCAAVLSGDEAIVFDVAPSIPLAEELRARRVRSIPHLILSHMDYDHIGGIGPLIDNFVVQNIWFIPDPDRVGKARARCTCHDAGEAGERGGGAYEFLMKRLGARTGKDYIQEKPPGRGQAGISWRGVEVEWLGPVVYDRHLSGNANSLSVVARVSIEGVGWLLFPGDLDYEGLHRIEGAGLLDWSALWLVAPHHGGDTRPRGASDRLVDRLLELTHAGDIFYSFDRRRYRLPLPKSVTSAISRGANVVCSQLSKRCVERADARIGSICGGSVELIEDSGFPIWAGRRAHQDRVRDLEIDAVEDGVICRRRGV
jgi:beta-lactamase superfamily II metal-dependent hydrolase